ncbi:unnamed protein product [Adineta ricciae]|uniref:Uncharacterized protein n=1 Tax=Adineta ricciae TaxID=249248 RepID=A0A815ZIQ2_ADIRI|nr:unnamed protein product [Adineta ricciae]CAF1583329.1 unnamed protein product [Adineta ricciae]
MARSGSDRIFPVQFRPESGGKEPARIGENCAGIDSDFNGFSRRNDRHGKSRLFNHQLNQQISFYYSIGLHRFFADLVLFGLYRNP